MDKPESAKKASKYFLKKCLDCLFLRSYSEGGWWSESLYLTRFIRKTWEFEKCNNENFDVLQTTCIRRQAFQTRFMETIAPSLQERCCFHWWRWPGSQNLNKIMLERTKQWIWNYPPRNNHVPSKGGWEDELSFPLMGYVSSLEGSNTKGLGETRRFFPTGKISKSQSIQIIWNQILFVFLFSKYLSCRPMK